MKTLPRKYCRPGHSPEESPEPCVPDEVAVDLTVNTVIVVSLEGEAWFENASLNTLTEPMEEMLGKPSEEH